MTEQTLLQPFPILPERLHYATAYIPYQYFGELLEPEQGLEYGTVFPELTDEITRGNGGTI